MKFKKFTTIERAGKNVSSSNKMLSMTQQQPFLVVILSDNSSSAFCQCHAIKSYHDDERSEDEALQQSKDPDRRSEDTNDIFT
jgi:hypothetical protein